MTPFKVAQNSNSTLQPTTLPIGLCIFKLKGAIRNLSNSIQLGHATSIIYFRTELYALKEELKIIIKNREIKKQTPTNLQKQRYLNCVNVLLQHSEEILQNSSATLLSKLECL